MQSYGNISKVETERELVFNYDSKTGNSVTITYEVPEDKAIASLPGLGSRTSLMSGVILKKATVKPGEGGIASVRLEYLFPAKQFPGRGSRSLASACRQPMMEY